ncbi:MAG: DUF4430 domain-containing protein [Ruminococcaceae bacterium]|nr:DUF4430 domain-containing protein [Oscillospiraceae bacterium]
MRRFLCFILAIFLPVLFSACSGEKSEKTAQDGEKMQCTLEIRCDTLLPHLDELSAGKAELVPEDGVLLAKKEVDFSSGESVFDVFRRVLREEKLHFEYVDTQIYNSVYIEGIGNLYEFDCGPQSGWMYTVNEVRPGLGCSAYLLSDGDEICFSYTCDLGADLGLEFHDEE